MCRFVNAQHGNISQTSSWSDTTALTWSGDHLQTVGWTALLTVLVILMMMVIYMAVSGPDAPAVPETDKTSFNGRVYAEKAVSIMKGGESLWLEHPWGETGGKGHLLAAADMT